MTKFKAGDKVRFIDKSNTAWYGVEGVVEGRSPGGNNLVRLTTPASGWASHFTQGGLAALGDWYLELIEEKPLTLDGFTVGDKVRYKHNFWENLEGTVHAINGSYIDVMVTKLHDKHTESSSVKVGKSLVETCGGLGINPNSLEKIEEPKATVRDFKAGDRVEFVEDYFQGAEKGTKATVVSISAGEFVEVKTDAGESFEPFPWRLKVIEDKPFTFEDIQVGDTIRRTQTFKGGSTEVREGTVTHVKSWYVAAEGDDYILAYDTDDKPGVTLELLNRPEPEPVKEVWELAKTGDRLVVKGAHDTTRILTKQEDGNWDCLLIRDYGTGKGIKRNDAEFTKALADKVFSADGKYEFIKA